ncbi:hypothetical protein C0J52_09469 [Blattella germanica]|nr:hypothetical protein C0J52_09469 [Blattella germanica]
MKRSADKKPGVMVGAELILLVCAVINFTLGCTATENACPAQIFPSSYELLKYLTHPSRYSQIPPGPVNISTRLYFYHTEVVNNLRYNVHMLLQFRYVDPRLAFHSIPTNITEIIGGEEVKDMIWTPHTYFVNDQRSAVMGSLNKDFFVSIQPDGTVFFAKRVKSTLTCWMKLHKFPFDAQQCSLMIESWVFDSNDLTLEWEEDNPVSMPPTLNMAEFYISKMWTNVSKNTDFYSTDDFELRLSSGNYSALMVTFYLRRQVGFYMMDYFIPSMLLVFISWVSFWLDANALSGRTALGVSTMLTLIALSTKTSSALPKVSYVLASEIWFIVCTAFIIGSLFEFAFVNVIWRRGTSVDLKKVNSKYIFKSTLAPKHNRRDSDDDKLRRDSDLNKFRRDSDVNNVRRESDGNTFRRENDGKKSIGRTISGPPHFISGKNRLPVPFTAQGAAGLLDIPKLLYIHDEELEYEGGHVMRLISEDEDITNTSFTTMTSSQIAKWIDTKSRFVFPLMFLIFNMVYWGSVVLDLILNKP